MITLGMGGLTRREREGRAGGAGGARELDQLCARHPLNMLAGSIVCVCVFV